MPDGSRLSAVYESPAVDLQILAPGAAMAPAAVTPAVAAWVRSRLAPDVSLGDGDTRRVMAPRFGLGSRATPGGEAKIAAGKPPTKFVTLFPLRYKGIPLSKGSDYLAITGSDGKLLLTRARSLPAAVDAVQPTVSPAEAAATGRAHAAAALDGETAEVDPPKLEIWVDRERKGTLAWTYTLRSSSLVEPVARRYWIQATGQPRVVAWESLIYNDHRGTVTATVWETTPLGPQGERPLADLGVTRLGAGTRRVFTVEDGTYLIPGGAQQAFIQAGLAGISCGSRDAQGNQLERNATGTSTSPIDLRFDATGDTQLSQTSSYFWCDFAHAFAQLPPDVLRILSIRVNLDRTCNAFYSRADVSLNFFRAGEGCVNTAYSDIVLHEYGHATDDERGEIVDGGYSEGFGDALAILGTRQPCTGRDFRGAGTCLRNATDVVTLRSPNDEVHEQGRAFGSFVQELVELLSRRLSVDEAFAVATDLVLAANAANPSDIPDAVRLMFAADDDDGNPATCSPHALELILAAERRNIPRPSGGAGAPGNLDIRLQVAPGGGDPGRFDIRLDGATVLNDAGNGASTGLRPTNPGLHRITQAGEGGTDLKAYRTFFGGACDTQGNVTVRSCRSSVCTINNLFEGGDCRQDCADERDTCLEDPDTLPRVCVQLLRACLATCN